MNKEEQTQEKNAKEALLYWLKTALFVLASSFLVAFSVNCFILPNDFTVGGVAGIAILLNAAFNIPTSLMTFCINAPLVIISYFFVKKKFAILTTVNICLQSLWLALFENVFPDFQIQFATNGEKMFAAIGAGLCLGPAIPLAFKVGGSTGGLDILALLIQRIFTASSIAWIIFSLNCIIIGSSIFIFRGDTLGATLLPIMMSAFEGYVDSKVNETITNGFHSAIEFRIITNKPEEMANALMQEIHRGVTSLPATGMYTKTDRSMLLCVVSRRQAPALKKVMKSVDPDSFAVMSTVSQVLGLGFYAPEV